MGKAVALLGESSSCLTAWQYQRLQSDERRGVQGDLGGTTVEDCDHHIGHSCEGRAVCFGDENGRHAQAMSRCWPGGPAQVLFNAEPIYFVQTPHQIWILWQRDHLVRRILS